MMKKLTLYILSLLCVLPLLSGCSNDEPTPEPEPEPEPEQKETPRTVLVYMIANNNLGYNYEAAQYDVKDIREMELAAKNGAFGSSRLIVFRHAYLGPAQSEMKLLEVTPEGTVTLKTYEGMSSSASEETMKQVIADMKTMAPARKYGIVLWSHASGWLNTGIDTPKVSMRSFGYDGSRTNSMSINSLANVLNGEGFDFIYFDCCYMGSVEVAYELRNAATRMTASAAELPVNGTPYHLALPYLMPEDADPAAAARETYTYYQSQYNPDIDFAKNPDAFGCTFATYYLPEMENLAQTVKTVYETGKPATGINSIQQFAPSTCRWYYCDLADVVASHIDEDNSPELSAFHEALDRVVETRGATPGIHLENTFTVNSHCGLSTYLPRSWSDFDRENYHKLSWYNDVASFITF